MLEFSRRGVAGAVDFATNALEEALLWPNASTAHTQKAAPDERVCQATDYLCAHLVQPFRLQDLAVRSGLSVSRFAHLFKDQTGSTPQQYLEHRRMQHASHLLRLTGLSVVQVAREVG